MILIRQIINILTAMSEDVEGHILKKYDLLVKLGRGAYGIVWKAVDKQTKKVVALKKVFDAFHNPTDAQRTFRQVMFLQQLKGHENIVSLQGMIKAENNKDIYLVFDFMDSDLHAVIRAGLLEEVHRQFVIYQILKAIKYMHSGGIIHRDLKPSNILLDEQCLVKVADFGLARSVAQQSEDTVMTQYVATRWYRAPEILLGSSKYTKAVDMWSIGCILAQMFIAQPLFPGNSTINQISRILEVIGRPSREDIESIQSSLAKECLDQITIEKKKPYSKLFPTASDEALDLIKRLLVMNPNRRLTVEQALRHPYLKDFSNPIEEIECPKVIEISMDDNTQFTIREYRQALYNEILRKKKQEDEARRQSFQKQQEDMSRQQKLRRNHEAVSREREEHRKPERRDILRYDKENTKYRDYDAKEVSKEKVGPKSTSGISRSIQKPFAENTTATNTRVEKSKTFYVSQKDYYKLGSSQLDKSVGDSAANGRKSENMYARVGTSNHPYRKR